MAFLDEMRANGAAQEYEPIIKGEIAERMREMERLQKLGLEDEPEAKPAKPTAVRFVEEGEPGEDPGREQIKGKRKNIPKGSVRHNKSMLQSAWQATDEAERSLKQGLVTSSVKVAQPAPMISRCLPFALLPECSPQNCGSCREASFSVEMTSLIFK